VYGAQGDGGWGNRSGEAGFTYLGVLALVAILGVNLAVAGVVWHVHQQREKESQLLFVGNQFRAAIGRYYLNQLGPQKEYPKRLEDLLRDPRHPGTVRYLRKLYADPMTALPEWGLIKTPDGSIIGVRSLSEKPPIKVALFPASNRHLEQKSRYSEWTFVYLPGQTLGTSAPSTSPIVATTDLTPSRLPADGPTTLSPAADQHAPPDLSSPQSDSVPEPPSSNGGEPGAG
jgi:type II secretory pathway pseudopilin PulG